MINLLDDNYSSEEELKEIISSEKQRKRSGGGHIKDAKSQHRENMRDHHRVTRHDNSEDEGRVAKLLSKTDGNAGQIETVTYILNVTHTIDASKFEGFVIIP